MNLKNLMSRWAFLLSAVSLSLVFVLSSCDSSKSLISDYTKFVESVEVAAENGDTHLLESFSADFDKFEARKAELLKKAAVSKAEADELEKLSGRYAAAVTKLSIKKAAGSVGNFLDGLLGN